ncbi:hypothetical protein IFM89_020453 [Coptis chinensis]|uniref:Uncharacterized protein n=1 Tax=Coptis chinensis TaxID=261450 RepID=A0A835H7J4_9MAGN|nr:hypothetical protein IFM89_020453 [Coptis chinensis]
METEETIPEETMVEKADEDKEFVAGPKRKIGDKKPAATAKTAKPAATRRNRGQTSLKPKLITDVLKPQRANCRAGKWSKASAWEPHLLVVATDWKRIAEHVMRLYTETTGGSWIESKESALVWHHQDTDSNFESYQCMKLLNHFESVLANEPVVVNKGLVAEKAADFVMCMGDDKSDEDMFEAISSAAFNPSLPEVFACTVGQKPSKAKYTI